MVRPPVVRNCSKLPKAELHDLLMVGWQRAVARHGRGAWTDALEITDEALRKQLNGSMPSFETVVDAYSCAGDVLDDLLDRLGSRIVPKDATCDTDDLRVLLARVMLKLQEAVHPTSPGGAAIVHQEYLDAEAEMRALHKLSGDWIQMCADIRKPRSVA